MSTPPPPPPPESNTTSAMSSAVPSPTTTATNTVRQSQVSQRSELSPPPTYSSADFKTGELKSTTQQSSLESPGAKARASQMTNVTTSSNPLPPPPPNKSLTSQHSDLQKSVDKLYMSSTEQYSRMGPESGKSSVYDSQQLSTAETLGAAALQLEKERAVLREQRAQESFVSSVRISKEFEKGTAEGENAVKALQATVEALTREKEAMVRELDDARSEIYDLRREVEAAKNSENKDGLSSVKGALEASSGPQVSVARMELEGYKKQLEGQEMLINGFQKENEKVRACQQLYATSLLPTPLQFLTSRNPPSLLLASLVAAGERDEGDEGEVEQGEGRDSEGPREGQHQG